MNISENSEKYIKSLREYNRDNGNRYTTRRISFFNREEVPAMFSLGYVETISQNDNMQFYSEEEVVDERFETLEAQLKEVPRKNSVVVKKAKLGTANAPLKLHVKVSRYKSIIEPRKFIQPYRVVGSEGEENAEFKHPLGKFYEVYYNILYFTNDQFKT